MASAAIPIRVSPAEASLPRKFRGVDLMRPAVVVEDMGSRSLREVDLKSPSISGNPAARAARACDFTNND